VQQRRGAQGAALLPARPGRRRGRIGEVGHVRGVPQQEPALEVDDGGHRSRLGGQHRGEHVGGVQHRHQLLGRTPEGGGEVGVQVAAGPPGDLGAGCGHAAGSGEDGLLGDVHDPGDE
jgi:hypothetical protein